MNGDRRGQWGDRRDEARNPTSVKVRICAGNQEGKGLLVDLSYSGARVEECSWVPPVGSQAQLRFEVPGVGPLALTGTVQCYGRSSIALICDAEDASERQRVDRVTALLFAASTHSE